MNVKHLGKDVLKIGAIFALIAGFVFIFGAVNVSAGGCCCYADSCLNQINTSTNISVAQAYLKVEKLEDKCFYKVGDEVGYTIVVRNLGNATAYHVTVEDVLPKDLTSIDNSLGMIYVPNKNGDNLEEKCAFSRGLATNESGKVLKCTIPKIQANGTDGSTVVIYFKAKVTNHTQVGNHINNVSVNGFYSYCADTSGQLNQDFDGCPCDSIDKCNQVYGETDIANGSENYEMAIQTPNNAVGHADLSDSVELWIIDMEKNTTTPYRTYSSIAEYEIKFNTDGKTVNASIVDKMPDGFTYVDGSAMLTGLGCTNGSVSHAGETFNLTNVRSSETSGCILKYNATIASTQADGDYVNNATATFTFYGGECNITLTDNASVHILRNPKLTVNKDVLFYKAFQPGDTVPYVIHVRNPGDTVTQNITVLDIPPQGYNLSSAKDNFGKIYRPSTECKGGPCSVKTTNAINNTSANVTVTCAGGSEHNHTMTVGAAQNGSDGSDGNCQYTVNCTSNTTCSVTYNSCGVVKVEGDTLWTDPSVGYKLTWCRDTLDPGTNWDIYVNFSVLSEASGSASINKVEVTANDGLLWKDVAPSVVIGQSILRIEKKVEKGTVPPGEDIWYTINIVNQGIAEAVNLTVVDDPAEAIQDSAYTRNEFCEDANGNKRIITVTMTDPSSQNPGYGDQVTYSINGSIKPGERCYFDYKAKAHPKADERLYPNNAVLYANDTSGKPLPEISAQAYVQVVGPQASIKKTVVGGPIAERVEICKNITFEIKIENNGVLELQNIIIEDTFPEGLEYLSASIQPNETTSTYVKWINPFNISAKAANDSVPPSKSINVTFKVMCNATPGIQSNVAEFTAQLSDGTPVAGRSEKTFEIASADLTITKRATPSQVNAGEKVRFDIEIKNNAIVSARNVYILDTLPLKFVYNHDVAVVAGNCNVHNTGNSTNLNFIINNGGNISGYQSCLFSFTANVSAGNGCPGMYNNTAELHYTVGDCGCNETIKSANATVEVLSFLRFTISKSADDTNLEPGKPVNFTLTVSNVGNDAIVNATVIDKLPDGFVYISSGGGYNLSNDSNANTATWHVNVSVGGTETLWLYANVTSNADSGKATNCANITSDLKNGNETCASYNASACTYVYVHKPNVTVLKRATAKNVTPNSTVTYELYVSNTGNAMAYNVNVSDKLPDSFSYSSNGYSVVCLNMNGNPSAGFPVTVFFGPLFNLSQGATCIISYNVQVPDEPTANNNCVGGSGGELNCTNIVNVTYQDGAGSTYSTGANESIIVKRDVRLNIAKSANVSYAQTNDTIKFTIVVTNDGANTAKGVNVTDNVPSDFEILNVNPMNTSPITNNTVRWDNQEIPAHGSKTYTITVNTLPAAQGDPMNNVTYYYLQENKSANASVHILSPKLNISKWTDVSEPVRPNSTVIYNIVVKNTGDADAMNVNVTDVLPVGLTYNNNLVVSAVSTGCAQGQVTNTTAGQETTFTIGTLPASTMCWFTYSVYVNDSATNNNYTNNATVNGTKTDGTTQIPGAVDNETIEVIRDVKLSVVKTANVTVASPGDQVNYTITITNDGINTAKCVNISDELPTGFEFVSATPQNDSGDGQVLNWTCVNISRGSITYNIIAKINGSTAGTGRTNWVNVYGDQHVNASAYVKVRSPVLNISKWTDATLIRPNSTITYNIVVKNTGDADAANVVVNDTFDTTLITHLGNGIAQAVSTGCAGTIVANPINNHSTKFTIGNLPSGTVCWFTYEVNISNDANGYYTNNATVNGTKTDGSFTPGAEDNETINVIPNVKLSVIKTANVTEVAPGDKLTYTITVKNDGDNAAMDAVINDTLPTGLTCNAAFGDATGTCNTTSAPNWANWTITIPAHGFVTLKINATVTASAIDPAHNVVNVTSTYSNANATLDIPVRKPTLTIDKSANKKTADKGEYIDYVLVIRNTGTGPATNISITDVDDEYNSSSSSGVDCGYINTPVHVDTLLSPTCTITNLVNISDSTRPVGFNVTITSTLQAGEQCVIKYSKYVGDVNSSAGQTCNAGDWINNTANITNAKYLDGTNIPKEPAWNDTWDVIVTDTNIVFTKNVTPAFVQPGDQVTYVLNASNSGNTAYEVVIKDTLPVGFKCHSINASDGTSHNCATNCNTYTDGQRQVCTINLNNIATGSSVNVTIVANVTSNASDGANTNLAELSFLLLGGGTDVDVRGNKTSTATNYVFRPHLQITKLVNDTKVINAKPGDTINYTIVIKNIDSIGAARNVTIEDNLPMQGPGGFNYSSNLFAVNCTNTTPITMTQDADKDTATFTIDLIENKTECRFSYNVTIDERNVADAVHPNTANITQILDNAYGKSTNSSTYGVGDKDTANVNIITVTNLKVVKSADPGQVQPGDQVTFTIDVTNYGASNPVYNVTLKDLMPPGVEFISNVTNCSVTSSSTNGNTANYTISQVNVNEHCYINITAKVTTLATTTTTQLITNKVSTTYNFPDGTDGSPPNATASVTVVKPDLNIYKSNNATATVAPSSTVLYTVTVENIGGGDAVNVTIHDVLPAGLTHTATGISYTGCGGAQPAQGNGSAAIDFSNISIENNSKCIIKYNVTVEHIADGLHTNTANISQAKDNDSGDAAGVEETATSTILVKQSSNLQVTKTVDLSVAEPGDTVKFTINLTNSPAKNPIYNVTTNDVLPEGYIPVCTVNEVTPKGTCDCNATTRRVNCTFTNITETELAQFNITATLNGTAVSADNIVRTNYTLPDGTVQPGPSAQVHVEVVGPNLKIYKNKNETIVYPGDTLRYEVIVMNTGQGKAKNITVRDVRQPGFIDADNYELICNGTVQTANLTNTTINETTIDFTINHTMESGETCHIYYDVTVTDNGTSCLCPGSYPNTATIMSAQGNAGKQLNGNEGINSWATTSISLGEGSNIKVVKTVNSSSVQANDEITFTINITNIDGKNPVFNMTVTDTLPDGFNVQSVSASGNSSPCYNVTTRTVSCNFSKINKSAGHGIYQIIIAARVNASANPMSINNVDYSYKTPCCEEKTGHTDAAINVRKPKLDIEKWTNNPISIRGATVNYCFRVRNDGGADVNNVKVHDVLSSPFTYKGEITDNAGGCLSSYPSAGSSGDFNFSCNLNASSSFVVCYNVSTNHASNGYYDNTVNITNATYLDGTVLSPLEGIGETSQSRVTIDNIQRITVKKEANQTVQPGQNIEYKITVTNFGNVNWENGTVTDTLASDVVYVTSSNGSVEGTHTGNTVTWTEQVIPQGENKTYNITVTALSNTSSPVWNSVRAEGENVSDDADAITYVIKPDLLIEKMALNETVLPGENVTYKIKIINRGYGDAMNITLNDVMPSNITHADNVNVLSCDGNAVTMTSGDGTTNATFKLNGLLHGGTYCEFTYDGHVWERQKDGLYTNQITMNANDTNGTPLTELVARSTIQVKSLSGMFVVKNNAILPFGTCAQGEDVVNFTIEMHNAGDVPLYDVSVTDTLPDGLTAQACTNNTMINGGTVSCTIESPTKVTWNISIIPAKNTTTVWITAEVGCNALYGTLTNEVSALAIKTDFTEIQDDDYATVRICTKSDIEWYKSTKTQGPVNPGDNVTYTISVRNRGESRARSIILTDTLPSGWTLLTIGPIVDSCGNSWNVTGSGSSVANFTTNNFNGSSFCSFDITARVPSTTEQGSYCNKLSGYWNDCEAHNGPDKEVCIGVQAGIGIDIKKELYPKVVKHGDIVDYKVTIWNYGPAAVDVDVSDDLPKGLELLNCSFNTSSVGNYLHKCAGTVTIPAASSMEYHIRARVSDDMTDQEFTNTIYADANVPNGHGKSSTVTGYVEDPELSIVKWADETDVAPGALVTFYIQIQNPTETNIIDLNVSDVLPKGFEYKYNSSMLEGQPFNESNPAIFNVTPGVYNESSNNTQQNITWKIGSIAAKTTKLLTFKAYVRCDIRTGELGNVNSVCVNGTTHDNEMVGACTNYTIIGHLANMSITKYANKNNVRWFDVVEYTITIRNPAYESAHSILQQLNDTMAPKLKYINNSATIDGTLLNPNVIIGSYNNANGTTLIWNGTPFNETAVWMGSTVVLKYKVLVMPGANNILQNNVTLDYLDPPMDGSGDISKYAPFRVGINNQIVRDTVELATGNTQQPVQTITYPVTQSATTIDRSESALNEIDSPCVVPIREGWNLISLPRHPISDNLSSVMANVKDKYTDVFTYDGYTWSYTSEYMDKWFGELKEMHEGVGYWVKATEACADGCEIRYACDKVTDANITLKEGWNLIGPIQTSQQQQSRSVTGITIPYTDIFGYDGSWSYKSIYMNKEFGELNTINLTKGYWVKVESSATMQQ